MRAPSILAALLCLAAAPAVADVIDGEWCTVDGRQHMVIQGPSIQTPGGARIQGDYSRHNFAYVVPEREPNAGHTVRMTLVNEETVHSQSAANPAAIGEASMLVWHRCKRPVS